jgi:hypothetical protein
MSTSSGIGMSKKKRNASRNIYAIEMCKPLQELLYGSDLTIF